MDKFDGKLFSEITKNISMYYCPYNELKVHKRPKFLILILSWFFAKDENLEKIRQIYFRYGFDVVLVKTPPIECVFPTIGTQRTVSRLLEEISRILDRYDGIVVHAFSIGGYIFGEILVQLNEEYPKHKSRVNPESIRSISKSIKGVIYDSPVNLECVPLAVEAIFAKNSVTKLLYPLAANIFLSLPLSSKHFKSAATAVQENRSKYPIMGFLSHSDPIASPESHKKFISSWIENDVELYYRFWDDTKHVAHYHQYPEEYVKHIDSFIRLLSIKPNYRIQSNL